MGFSVPSPSPSLQPPPHCHTFPEPPIITRYSPHYNLKVSIKTSMYLSRLQCIYQGFNVTDSSLVVVSNFESWMPHANVNTIVQNNKYRTKQWVCEYPYGLQTLQPQNVLSHMVIKNFPATKRPDTRTHMAIDQESVEKWNNRGERDMSRCK